MYCLAASAPLFTLWAFVVRVLADQMSFPPFSAKIDASAVTVITGASPTCIAVDPGYSA